MMIPRARYGFQVEGGSWALRAAALIRVDEADEVIHVVGDSGLQRVHYWESVTFCFIG